MCVCKGESEREIEECQHLLYCDVIYLISRHLTSEFFGASLPQHRKDAIYGMPSLLEPIEWSYGEIKQMFPFLLMKDNREVQSSPVGDICIIFHL